MLRTLKMLCILLKVFMLTITATAVFSTDQEDRIVQDTLVFKLIDAHDYYMLSNLSIESVEKYSDSDIVRNEVALQEVTTSSPENIPSEPTFPRAFVEFGNRLNKSDIFVTFRWKQPEFTNGKIQKYRVQYWFIDSLKRIQTSVDISPAKILQHKVYDLKPDTMYYFKVQAHNEVGAGPYTKFINVSTTHENSVPLLLVNSWYHMHVLDIDLQIVIIDKLLDFWIRNYGYITGYGITYSALEHKIYLITSGPIRSTRGSMLMTCNVNPNINEIVSNCRTITAFGYNANIAYKGPCIDWVARNLYWIQYNHEDNTSNFMKLDLTLLQMGIFKSDNILKINGRSEFLNVLPSIGYLYWTELISDNQYIIMQSDYEGKNITPFLKNKDNICFCPYKLLELSSYIHIDNTNIDKPLIYWTLRDRLIAADINGCKCNLILSAGNDKILFNYLTIDKTNIYLYSRDENLIYILNKKYATLESKKNAFKHIQKANIRLFINAQFPQGPIPIQLTHLDKSLQPYPPTICLTPNIKDYHVEEKAITANSIIVSLPEPIPNDGCEKYNLATTIYNISVSYLTCLDNDFIEMKEFNVQTYERHCEIQNLMPFTEYTLKLVLSNFYVDKLSMGLQFGADVKLRTKFNAPENITIQVLTPTLAAVYWMPLKKLNCVAVNYEVHWVLFLNGIAYRHDKQFINQTKRTEDGKFFATIRSLLPGQEYLIYVRVYPNNFNNFFTDSLKEIIQMYSEPNNLISSGVSTNGMNILWIPTVNPKIHYKLEYKNGVMQKWQIADNFEMNNNQIIYYIKNLLPQTLYQFRLILRYPDYKEDFIWPSDERFTFKTLGNVTKIPSAPGIPTVTRLPNFTYQLNWEPAQANDSQYLTMYRLEGLIIEENYKEGNQTDMNKHWNLYYNGTNNYWIITTDMNKKYRFRVQAENPYGCGVWSKSSVVVDLTKSIEISAMQYLPYLYNYVPLISSIVVTLVICYVYYFYCSYRQRIKLSNEIVVPPIMTDIELVTLNEIPSGNVQLNTLYATRLQHNPDEFALTIIEKKHITLAKLLGSGAFGEVFQGIVKDFEGSDATPVAIKMLQKDASSQEKKKFLQEAKFMSQFRHKHVLRLLGICSDADSPMLILELMEGGDLLKYLKESRTLEPSDSHFLRLQDLLTMCEDVARGCYYLEELHFVHRDLACRNCLISARNRENRIVKIGDFGLARDIYKNDYYRMKGEGLLPIRWMAPESLMDGIFTIKSDVWAFGVLMWEIMSLGQRPYCAKNDSKVLQYVCAGGKLSKPLNCPPTLYQLMLRCWNAVNERPNFIVCLENITTLRDNIENAMLSSVDSIKCAELPLSGQIEDVVGSTASRTFEHLIANDASNDVIEPLT